MCNWLTGSTLTLLLWQVWAFGRNCLKLFALFLAAVKTLMGRCSCWSWSWGWIWSRCYHHHYYYYYCDRCARRSGDNGCNEMERERKRALTSVPLFALLLLLSWALLCSVVTGPRTHTHWTVVEVCGVFGSTSLWVLEHTWSSTELGGTSTAAAAAA